MASSALVVAEVVQPAAGREVGPQGGERLARPADVRVGRRPGRSRPTGAGGSSPPRGAARRSPSGPTRVTAPWKCSNRIAVIGEGTAANRSTAVSISASGRPAGEAREPVVERARRGSRRRAACSSPDTACGPTCDHQRRSEALNGASSRSAASGSPAWKTTSAASFAPEPSGACTRPAKTVRSSDASRDRVAVEAQQLGRGVERVGDQPAGDRPDRVQAVRERGGDAEVAAAAAQRPEQVRVRGGVDLQHLAGRRHELDGEQVVGREPVLAPSASPSPPPSV